MRQVHMNWMYICLLSDIHLMYYSVMCSILQRYFKGSKTSQEALANLMGVRQPTISRWAKGRVPAERVLKVSKLTGIPPEELRPDVFRSPC